jgi:hypothetical protein
MYIHNREPSIDDVLSDPLIKLVMERAGLSDEGVRALIADTKRRIAAESFAGSKPLATDT